MLYDYTCGEGHRHELVRPLGTDSVPCPRCGADAERSHIHRFDVVGPTVDTRGQTRRFVEAIGEMEYGFTSEEAKDGTSIERPDMWAPVMARTREKIKRGELDVKEIRKNREGGIARNVRLG